MLIIVSNCQHCDEQQFKNTVMCTLHDFHSSKVRFIHTSTVTGSNSCSEKNYEYASRTSCISYFRIFRLCRHQYMYIQHCRLPQDIAHGYDNMVASANKYLQRFHISIITKHSVCFNVLFCYIGYSYS